MTSQQPAQPADGEPADPTPEELARATPAVVRRAPRFRAFAIAGILVTVLAVTVLMIVRPAPEDAALGTGSMWLLLVVTLGAFGALAGTLVAVLVDRRSRRQADRAAGRPTSRRRRRRQP